MAEPNRPSPDGDGAVPTGPSTPAGFEHLGWSPSWRDRLASVLGGAPPGRLAAGAAAVVVALVVGFVALRAPAPPPPELMLPVAGGAGDPGASTTTTTGGPAEVVVHAAGAVGRPGVYRLAAGSRVADLLDAAGGPAADADLDRLNLAAPLQDGDRVFVPAVGQDVPAVVAGGTQTGAGAEGAAAPIDLNSATLAELDTLPGIGPATAQAILDERERRGGFRTVEDLLDVRGIGEAKLAAIRDLVRV